jgi:hypothetical protein
MISQEVITMLLLDNLQNNTETFTPTALAPPLTPHLNFEHYAMPMVRQTTGKIISSYKQLMNNPVTANTCQMAFGKDFVSMCQGDNKTGAKGTNATFMMKPEAVDLTPAARLATYANVVVDYRPQKDNPDQIFITAGGSLINYPGKLTTRTADVTTSKPHWNSVLSTQQAKYMCLNLKNFYLSVPLDQYKYMRILIGMFPVWIVAQYDLLHNVVKGQIYLEMQRAIWGLAFVVVLPDLVPVNGESSALRSILLGTIVVTDLTVRPSFVLGHLLFANKKTSVSAFDVMYSLKLAIEPVVKLCCLIVWTQIKERESGGKGRCKI